MKMKSTLTKWSFAFILCGLLFVNAIAKPATYCEPTFANGCFNWHNIEVYLGSINWLAGGSACTDFNYTAQSTTLNAGSTTAMTVTSGVWCGCSVWIDLNQDELFDPVENVYHSYVGGDPSYTYSFNVNIPSNVPTGSYRMRIVAGWGSDGFTSGGSNGYGPCGAYQYGNFSDFTVNVIGTPLGLPEVLAKSLHFIDVSPNPASDQLVVSMNAFNVGKATLQLSDMAGKIIRTIQVTKDKENLDVSALAKGIYFLHYNDGVHMQSLRIFR